MPQRPSLLVSLESSKGHFHLLHCIDSFQLSIIVMESIKTNILTKCELLYTRSIWVCHFFLSQPPAPASTPRNAKLTGVGAEVLFFSSFNFNLSILVHPEWFLLCHHPNYCHSCSYVEDEASKSNTKYMEFINSIFHFLSLFNSIPSQYQDQFVYCIRCVLIKHGNGLDKNR